MLCSWWNLFSQNWRSFCMNGTSPSFIDVSSSDVADCCLSILRHPTNISFHHLAFEPAILNFERLLRSPDCLLVDKQLLQTNTDLLTQLIVFGETLGIDSVDVSHHLHALIFSHLLTVENIWGLYDELKLLLPITSMLKSFDATLAPHNLSPASLCKFPSTTDGLAGVILQNICWHFQFRTSTTLTQASTTDLDISYLHAITILLQKIVQPLLLRRILLPIHDSDEDEEDEEDEASRDAFFSCIPDSVFNPGLLEHFLLMLTGPSFDVEQNMRPLSNFCTVVLLMMKARVSLKVRIIQQCIFVRSSKLCKMMWQYLKIHCNDFMASEEFKHWLVPDSRIGFLQDSSAWNVVDLMLGLVSALLLIQGRDEFFSGHPFEIRDYVELITVLKVPSFYSTPISAPISEIVWWMTFCCNSLNSSIRFFWIMKSLPRQQHLSVSIIQTSDPPSTTILCTPTTLKDVKTNAIIVLKHLYDREYFSHIYWIHNLPKLLLLILSRESLATTWHRASGRSLGGEHHFDDAKSLSWLPLLHSIHFLILSSCYAILQGGFGLDGVVKTRFSILRNQMVQKMKPWNGWMQFQWI